MRTRERDTVRGRGPETLLCHKHSARIGENEANSPNTPRNIPILHLLSLQLGKKSILLTTTLADPDKINSWCLIPAAGQLILPPNPLISLAIHLFGACISPRCRRKWPCKVWGMVGVGAWNINQIAITTAAALKDHM